MKTFKIRINEKEEQSLNKDEIIEKYLPFVRLIAKKIASRVPKNIHVDDLISCGTVGLMDAIEKYNFDNENNFKTYAKFRIRGAMLDELRSQDWVPRSVRKKNKMLEKAVNTLKSELGRDPDLDDLSKFLKMSKKELHTLLKQAKPISVLSLDEKEKSDSNMRRPSDSFLHLLSDCHLFKPDVLLAEKNLQQQVVRCINNLPERERLVIAMYYYKENSLKSIGQCLKLTESRVSQIHVNAIRILKSEIYEKIGLAA